MKQITHRSNCTISCTLDILGDKWTLLVLRDMIFEERSSYREFMSSEEGIASNILADRLALLEREGLVTKKVSAANKSKFIYTLTEKAIPILPLMAELVLFGATYFDFTSTRPPELLEQLRKSKAATLKKYADRIRRRIKEAE
ncbi:winged helix-turn-helix transcriptional regulator [Chitinophaga japonensis]|uniref:HxlR family transcriptional regulator n=1 Tax=Chitinophaga japonensis TaxID=104662 RepID=A0A562T210_CHIJA|nr:helix-turn-helix domain-containing protein [Chitinophaga japonensis]TWI86840.1 HxlR family transcriptional regulator [Chitinophaga japonensis]